MQLSRGDIEWAVEQGLLAPMQAEPLWAALDRRASERVDSTEAVRIERSPVKARFDFLHLAYYFGALIVMSAMGMFMTLGWEAFGGGGIFVLASAYALAFTLAGRKLWNGDDTKIPGGLLFTMAVCMTPLAVYGLERALDLWPRADPGGYAGFHEYVRGGWFGMELATVVVALLALRFVRFPFLTLPVAFILWYVSMDLAPLLFGPKGWDERGPVSAAVGLVMLLVAYAVDRRTKEDFAFWLYLFGMLAFWGGITSMHSDSELRKLGYGLLNLGLIGVSVVIDRRVFMVFGALGVSGYLGYLAYDVFKDSLLFPFALSGLGIAILFAAVSFHRNRDRLARAVDDAVPAWLRARLPQSRV